MEKVLFIHKMKVVTITHDLKTLQHLMSCPIGFIN